MTEEMRQLAEKQSNAIAAMKDAARQLATEGLTEQRTAELNAMFSKAEKEQEGYNQRLSQLKRIEELEAQQADTFIEKQQRDAKTEISVDDAKTRLEIFRRALHYGFNALSKEERAIAVKMAVETRGTSTQVVGTDSLGGYTVPEGFSGELEVAMKWYGAMLEAARILNTSSGNPLPWPTLDDTNASGAGYGFKTEATGQVGVQDMTFSEVVFNSYVADSGMVKFVLC